MSELKEKKETSVKKPKAKKAINETKKVTKKVVEPKKEQVTKAKKTNEIKKEVVVKETNERKKEKALLDKKDQKRLKILTKIISVILKILRVCAMIIVPLMFIVMILIPIIFKDVEVKGNIIKFNDMNLVMHNDTITANIGDASYVVANDVQNIDSIVNFLNNNSIGSLVLDFELSIGFAIIVIVINIFILQYTEKLFNNFHHAKTPFTEENILYIRKIGKMMIVSLIVAVIFDIVLSIITKDICAINIGKYGIIEILGIYVIYYIFKYAVSMQKQVNTEIYE